MLVELEVAVVLVGRDVVQPLVVPPDRFEEREGPDQVRLDEGPGGVEAVVVVRLGGEVHDDVVVRDESVDEARVGHRPLDQLHRAVAAEV